MKGKYVRRTVVYFVNPTAKIGKYKSAICLLIESKIKKQSKK